MRRPLNWIVVSIALLVLLVNRWQPQTDSTAETPSPGEPQRAAFRISEDTSPFAYIREDGSELFLPVNESGPRLLDREQPTSATHAVFTWTAQPESAAHELPMAQ